LVSDSDDGALSSSFLDFTFFKTGLDSNDEDGALSFGFLGFTFFKTGLDAIVLLDSSFTFVLEGFVFSKTCLLILSLVSSRLASFNLEGIDFFKTGRVKLSDFSLLSRAFTLDGLRRTWFMVTTTTANAQLGVLLSSGHLVSLEEILSPRSSLEEVQVCTKLKT
jgi:hypothetical protein